MAFIDYQLAQTLSPEELNGRTTFIIAKLDPSANLSEVRDEIRRRLPYNDVHTKSEWASISRRYWIESTGLGLTIFLTVFLGCTCGRGHRGSDSLCVDDRAPSRVRHHQGAGRARLGCVRTHRRAGDVRRAPGISPGTGPDHGRGAPARAAGYEDDRDPDGGHPGFSRDSGALHGGFGAVVPQGGLA